MRAGVLGLLVLLLGAMPAVAEEPPACPPRGKGLLVNTRVTGTFWPSYWIEGDWIVYQQDPWWDGLDELWLAAHRIGTGETRRIPSLGPNSLQVRIEGNLIATEGAEFYGGPWTSVDHNQDGDVDDRFIQWHDLESQFSSGLIEGRHPVVAPPWIAFTAPGPAGYTLRLIDTRDRSVTDTGIAGSPRLITRRAVVYREEAGLGWIPLPGVTDLPPGHVTLYQASDLRGEDGLIAMTEQVLARPSFTTMVWLPTGEVVRLNHWASQDVDGNRIAYTSEQGTVVVRDFEAGTTTDLAISGHVWRFDADVVHLARGMPGVPGWTGWYVRLADGEQVLSFPRFPSAPAAAGDVSSGAVGLGDVCAGDPELSVVYHRISTGRSERIPIHPFAAYTLEPQDPSRRLIALTLSEAQEQRDLNPGDGGTGDLFLGYYVFPCESFDDLDEHLRWAVVDPEAERKTLQAIARRARAQHERGNPRGTLAALRSLTRRIEGLDGFATRSREIVSSCVSSLGISLGVMAEGDLRDDTCPLVVDPMQDDLDGDGLGAACDNCPFDPNAEQHDADDDGLGDACDACPSLPQPPFDPAQTWFSCSLGFYDHDGGWELDPWVGPGWADCDDDGLARACDNCQRVWNPGQEDADGDGLGDACDGCPGEPEIEPTDDDKDHVTTCMDICPDHFDPGQQETDGDGIGDACDNCPLHANPDQADLGQEGKGDVCDPDDDADLIPDAVDACPRDNRNDADGDGVCGDVDNCRSVANTDQADADGDRVGDACDVCPHLPNGSWGDRDGDGIGDDCDTCPDHPDANVDSDGDGWGDACDHCPGLATPTNDDTDGDGHGDACDSCPSSSGDDVDGDGICGDVDACPDTADPGQEDTDADGRGDACDNCTTLPNPSWADWDQDGRGDACDNCPSVRNLDQSDEDGDLLGDACDLCVRDPLQDWDGDGRCADVDNCPEVPNVDQADADGDGTGDACDG